MARLEKLTQWRYTDSPNRLTGFGLEKLGCVAGEDHRGLVSSGCGAVGGEVECQATPGRIGGTCGGNVEKLRHGR